MDKLTKEELFEVLNKVCPDCGGKLKEYASGGLSLNLECQNCHQCFGDYMFDGERIPSQFKNS
jgi:tRNA(Ile2) C34 agmatinyltransferase TiaS